MQLVTRWRPGNFHLLELTKVATMATVSEKRHVRECIAVGYPVLGPILSQSMPVGCFTTNIQVLQQRKDLLRVYRINFWPATGLVSG